MKLRSLVRRPPAVHGAAGPGAAELFERLVALDRLGPRDWDGDPLRWHGTVPPHAEPPGLAGPPLRAPGDELRIWAPRYIADDERAEWTRTANRIAIGVEITAHLEPIVMPDRLWAGFCCFDGARAKEFARLVGAENIEALAGSGHPLQPGGDHDCDVLLPCRPGLSDAEIDETVLAATRASHRFLV
jgi:hypothetical protein